MVSGNPSKNALFETRPKKNPSSPEGKRIFYLQTDLFVIEYPAPASLHRGWIYQCSFHL